MIEGIVTDVLTLLQVVYETVKGVKANSVARNVLLARIESLRAIISTIHAPAPESPVSSALLDIKETVQDISGAIMVHGKRGWAQKALKVSAEALELERLDKRLLAGQEQLCLAISTANVSQAVKNAEEVDAIFASKSKSLQEMMKAQVVRYQDRLNKHRQELAAMALKLERLYRSMEKYPNADSGVAPRAPTLPTGAGIGGITTLIRLGGTIISMVQSAKNNREEALAIGRRVQVVLDVIETLNSELLNDKVRRDEVNALMGCLQNCAKVVADQTAKGAVKQAVDVQLDKNRLRNLETELSERLLRLGIDLQLHLQKLETELVLNVNSNFSQLENDLKEASITASYNLDDSMSLVEEQAKRLEWIVDRAPFYAKAAAGLGEEIQDLSNRPILVNRVDCSIVSTDIQQLSVNKGITAIVPSHLWRELYCAVGRVVHVYDFKSGEYQTEIGRGKGAITVLGISSDKSKLLSYGQDRTIRLWDAAKKEELTSISPIQRCSVLELTAGPAYHIASHDYTSTQVFSRTNPQSKLYFHGDATFVLSADGSTMAVRGSFGIPIIATSSMSVVRTVPWSGRPGRLALSGTGQYLFVRENFRAGMTIFNLDDGSTLPPILFDGSEIDEQFYTDSQTRQVRVIAGTKGGSIKIWDIAAGSLYRELSDSSTSSPSPIYSVSVAENSAFGALVASLDASGLVRIWDIDTRTCLSRLGAGMEYVPSDPSLIGTAQFSVTLSPNGYKLLIRREKLIAICMLHGSTAQGKPKDFSEKLDGKDL